MFYAILNLLRSKYLIVLCFSLDATRMYYNYLYEGIDKVQSKYYNENLVHINVF